MRYTGPRDISTEEEADLVTEYSKLEYQDTPFGTCESCGDEGVDLDRDGYCADCSDQPRR